MNHRTARSPGLEGPAGEGSVALVITCFDQARFLASAVDSALAQSRAFDEIIIVDDGSRDDTARVAGAYPTVRYLRQENAGLAAARNAGLRSTTSEFIVFLDADDRLLPGCVEAGLCCFAAHPDCGFVYGHFRCVAADGSELDTPGLSACPEDAYAGFLRQNLVAMHAASMYRRAALLEAGGFDTRLPVCEDYDVYLRMARTHPVASHPAVIAQYRQHDANMSGNLPMMLATVLEVLHRQREYAARDPRRQAALSAGLDNWRNYYAGLILDRLATRARTRTGTRGAMRETLALARYAPRAAIRRVCRRATIAVLPWLPGIVRANVARLQPTLDYTPRKGTVAWGELCRRNPVSRQYGFDRGTPVDRYYIEQFLSMHCGHIRGRVLEVGDRSYTLRYGGSRVERSEVLNLHENFPGTTIVSDLTDGRGIADESFDCIVLTQTLHLLYDLRAAVLTLQRILKPGGTLLLTVPGTISQIERGIWKSVWYWGFTRLSLQRLFGDVFGKDSVDILEYGNVLASLALLEGISSEELCAADLDHRDAQYPLLIGVRVSRAP